MCNLILHVRVVEKIQTATCFRCHLALLNGTAAAIHPIPALASQQRGDSVKLNVHIYAMKRQRAAARE